jgi:pyruvate,water dikinase
VLTGAVLIMYPCRKTASLGELIQQLEPLGVAIPGGFAVCSSAYDAVLDRFQLRERLQAILKDVDGKNAMDRLKQKYQNIFY